MTTHAHEKAIIVRVEARERTRLFRGPTFWHVQVAANGEIVATSETYTTSQKRDQTGRQVADQLGVPYDSKGT